MEKAKEKGEKEYRILHWRTFGIEFECPMSKYRIKGPVAIRGELKGGEVKGVVVPTTAKQGARNKLRRKENPQ
jgi:hypothetical protein